MRRVTQARGAAVTLTAGHRPRPSLATALMSLRTDLRRALADAAAALLLSGTVLAVLVARLHAGVDPAAHEMPDMVRNGGVWAYSASQAVGWSALAWSWLTVQLGVSLPLLAQERRRRWRGRLERLHRSTSLTVLGLMIAHALLLLWDKMGDTLVTDFVPWTTSYVPGRLPQALGIVSLYVALLFGLTFYVRDKIGPRLWRTLHRYAVPAIYGLAVWHTFAYGSDVKERSGVWVFLWMMQAPIVIVYAWRIAAALRGS